MTTKWAISEFQNFSLSKRGYEQNLSSETEVLFAREWKKNNFHINSFALSLALKLRLEAAWKLCSRKFDKGS